ncbi:LysR family transcriptional regulator [Caballeronia sp. LZ065]|uniref:LysR family transcriptional regulator n=1 Tax=Caballeronia sp. LZ065 TaxID=3038571 RepID=UPI002860A219|nr:LysR family transcriptional regulator [Caballeronia sp. LZ065]MDR5784631.1 LysR family transcriptional regulator [Caballeronia sp. LZ065]
MNEAEPGQPLRLDLSELETFAAVAQCGSFNQAAARLHLSPPSVTARIKRLEERLQTRLLERTTRRLELTPSGVRVFETATRVLRELHGMLNALDIQQGRGGHRVTVAATPMIAATTVPAIIRSYSQRFIDVRIKLLDLQYPDLLAQVESGAADLAIAVFDHDAPALGFEALTEEALLLVMPLDHPFGGQEAVTLEQLAACPLMILKRYDGVLETIAQACRKRGITLPPPLEAHNLNTLMGMVDAGHGVTLLPRSLSQVNAQRARAALPLADMPMTRVVGVLFARDTELSAAAHSFREHVRSEYPKVLAAMEHRSATLLASR